jgi:hypothetical protein
MRARLIPVVAAAGLLAAVLPAHAATPKPQVVDPAGDANALNDQGLPAPVPGNTATPADDSAADIKSVLFQTTFKTRHVHGKLVRTPTGSTVTMTLAAAPVTNTMYRVIVAAAGCSTEIFFEYDVTPAFGVNDVRCAAVGLSSSTYGVGPAVAKGSTITWTLPLKAFPVGTTFTGLSAETRGDTGAAYAPVIDNAATTAAFTVGK